MKNFSGRKVYKTEGKLWDSNHELEVRSDFHIPVLGGSFFNAKNAIEDAVSEVLEAGSYATKLASKTGVIDVIVDGVKVVFEYIDNKELHIKNVEYVS